MADGQLDCRGLNCPIPVLRAKRVLGGMAAGQTLEVVATDLGSVKDFKAFAKQTGNVLVECKEVGNEFVILVRKA